MSFAQICFLGAHFTTDWIFRSPLIHRFFYNSTTLNLFYLGTDFIVYILVLLHPDNIVFQLFWNSMVTLWSIFLQYFQKVCGRFDQEHVSLSIKRMLFNYLNNKIWIYHRSANYFTLIYVLKAFPILWPTCWECVENFELLAKYKSLAILNIEGGLIIEEFGI